VELVVDKMTLVRLLVVAFSLFLPFIVRLMFPLLLNVFVRIFSVVWFL
jgi:hypothetical protein